MASTEATPVLYPVSFHPDELELSTPIPTDSTGGNSPLAGAGATLAAHALTKTATPESATSVSIRSVKSSSNCA